MVDEARRQEAMRESELGTAVAVAAAAERESVQIGERKKRGALLATVVIHELGRGGSQMTTMTRRQMSRSVVVNRVVVVAAVNTKGVMSAAEQAIRRRLGSMLARPRASTLSARHLLQLFSSKAKAKVMLIVMVLWLMTIGQLGLEQPQRPR
jgi:hypothetical protein